MSTASESDLESNPAYVPPAIVPPATNPHCTATENSVAIAEPPAVPTDGAAAPVVEKVTDTSVVDVKSANPFVEEGNACSKCGHPMGLETKVCCKCGFYATIGQYVEIEKPVVAEPERIPWELLAVPVVCLLILVESVAGRMLTHAESPDRRLWSVSHLVFGFLLFVVPHMRAQIRSYREDSEKTGLLGFVFHPFAIWTSTFKQLPKSLPWILSASAGLTALICSLLIGGLPSPFSKEPIRWQPKRTLTIAIPTGGKTSQEMVPLPIESLNIVETEAGQEEDSDKPRVYEDCVIVGYTLAAPGRVGSILVGKKFEGTLRMMGSVSEDIPPKVSLKLADALRRAPSAEPMVEGGEGTNWVKPKYHCRIWFHETEEGGRGALHYDRMLLLKKS